MVQCTCARMTRDCRIHVCTCTCTCTCILYVWVALLTFSRGTFSVSGEIMARISLVIWGGAPGSEAGAVPNSSLQQQQQQQGDKGGTHSHIPTSGMRLLGCGFTWKNDIQKTTAKRLDLDKAEKYHKLLYRYATIEPSISSTAQGKQGWLYCAVGSVCRQH